jgi:ATP-dependent Lon protease
MVVIDSTPRYDERPMMESADNPPSSIAATGPVRLFPLPGLVMFPHVVQPLHIFEPRYCDMLEDALAGNRQIGMVLLQPGWESCVGGQPPIASVACIGKVVAHERMPTGRHNILLRGLRRAAIRRECALKRAFRQAEVDLLDDFYPASAAKRRGEAQRELIELARRLLPDSDALHEQLDDLLASQASLGMLTDVFAFTLGFSTSVKQRLLAESNVDCRAALLLEKLSALASRQDSPVANFSDFPPRFSLN